MQVLTRKYCTLCNWSKTKMTYNKFFVLYFIHSFEISPTSHYNVDIVTKSCMMQKIFAILHLEITNYNCTIIICLDLICSAIVFCLCLFYSDVRSITMLRDCVALLSLLGI